MDASTGIENVSGTATGRRWRAALTLERATARPHAPRDWRPLGAAVVVGATYFAGAKIGMALTFAPLPLSVLWPPNALLFGALLLVPTRWWWALVLGALPAHLLAELQAGVPLTMVMSWFASNVTEALIGATIVRRFNGAARGLDSARAVTVFFCAAVCAPVLSSFLDAGLVRLNGWGSADYWTLWLARVPSNLLSVLTFVPVMITCAALAPAQLKAFTPQRRIEATALIVGLLLVSVIAFDARLFDHDAPMLLYLPVPFLVWAAMRFGPALTSASFTIVVFLVIWGATHGQGPFQSAARHDDALPLQLFLITIAVPLLWLAAVITQQRQSEQAAREQQRQLAHVTRVASMADFSNSLAHELSQPLTAILSNAQAALRFLAREPIKVEEIRTILTEIVAADKRAGLLIRHMRMMMRRSDLELADLDVNELIAQVLSLAHGEFVTRDVEVDTCFAPDMPMVRGDRVQLQQLLLNLVANACEAMHAVNAPKMLKLTTFQASDGSAQIVVSDNGPGVPGALVDSIFDAFYTTKAHGLGMGLPICRQIAQMHGGTLKLDPQLGSGASFRLALPARPQ